MPAPRKDIILITSIAKKLRSIRKARNITQVDVFLDTDIHVARVEMGKTNISVTTLSDLCKYYNITLEEFFHDIETSPSDQERK